MEKRGKQIEELQRQNIALLGRVVHLENQRASWKRKLDWLEKKKKMDKEMQVLET